MTLQSEFQEATSKFEKTTGIGINKTYVPNPGVSLLYFFIITTVYLVIKIFTIPSKLEGSASSMNLIWLGIYILLLIVGNYFINMSTTTALCGGTPQWGTTFIITVVPWVLIFGVINIVLIIFPGWLIPFSNTIGYFGAKLGGLTELFNDHIIVPKLKSAEIDDSDVNSKIHVAKALQHIYGNESLLINEIPRDGDNDSQKINSFKEFFKSMQKVNIFKKNIDEEIQVQLYNLLLIKDIVAEYIWNLLSGFLVTSISYNYIVNVGCSYSSKQMKHEYEKHLDDMSGNDTNNPNTSQTTEYENIMKDFSADSASSWYANQGITKNKT